MSSVVVIVALALDACSRERAQARADSSPGAASSTLAVADSLSQSVAPIVAPTDVCARPAEGIVVSLTSLGGLSAKASLGELVRSCSASTLDVYGIGGYQAAARVFHFAGAQLTAVQAHEGSLHYSEAPDLWAAEGDSVRLADGLLMPRTAGELRKRYPLGVVTSDKGDDSDGVRITACRFPGLVFILSYDAPTPAPVGKWPLSAKAVADTTRIFSVEVFPGRVEPDSSCAARPAT